MVHESRLIQLFIHESCLNIKIVSSGHEKILLYFLKLLSNNSLIRSHSYPTRQSFDLDFSFNPFFPIILP